MIRILRTSVLPLINTWWCWSVPNQLFIFRALDLQPFQLAFKIGKDFTFSCGSLGAHCINEKCSRSPGHKGNLHLRSNANITVATVHGFFLIYYYGTEKNKKNKLKNLIRWLEKWEEIFFSFFLFLVWIFFWRWKTILLITCRNEIKVCELEPLLTKINK